MSHIQDAVRQWAHVYGSERPDQAWLLSDYDTWERNPYYNGPAVRHPEDYDLDDECEVDGEQFDDPVQADADVLASAGWGTNEDYVCDNDYFDDIPF